MNIIEEKLCSKFLVIGQLPPPHHGSNVMTEIFIQSLERLGYNTTIVEKTFSKKIEDIGKTSILKIFKVPIITSKLIYHLIRNKYDFCFYFFSIRPPSIFADAFFLFFIRMFQVKYILYLHGKGLIDLNERISGPLGFFVRKVIFRSLGAIVLGERLKRDINHLIPNKHLFVLPNAIPDINSKKSATNQTGKNPIKILFLSNLIPSKGPLEFLKMVQKINKIDKNVHFFLAGANSSDRFFSKIKEFINDKKLRNHVTLTGPVYKEKKEKLFNESDIFVFPTHNEAFGLVNLEAMRAGLPVVSSNEGSIPEVVIDGVNGFIVDPKNIDMLTDRVLKLINDPELRIKMGKASRKIYEKKFTINSYQKKLEEALNFFTFKDKLCPNKKK